MWAPIPLVSQDIIDLGHTGGEGGQWVRAIAADSRGDLVIYGTDVGGLYRSRNGGLTWEPCNVGYTPRGTAGLAIDPFNSNRCVSVGANSAPHEGNGLYLSVNGGASWKGVMTAYIAASHDMRDQVCYDPSTFDSKAGYTKRVYWSRIADDTAMWGSPEQNPALYRSDDGGETWVEIPDTAHVAGSIIKNHPLSPILYAGNGKGVFRSVDGGKTFTKTFDGKVTGLDTTRAMPDFVIITTPDGVWTSNDAGLTFGKLQGAEKIAKKGAPLKGIKVSPADPSRMVLWREGSNWDWSRYASQDGGVTWTKARMDNKGAFLPYNARQGVFAWHGTDPNVAWSTGADWPTITRDAGKTWGYSGDGFNAVLVGGRFNFNQQDPDLVFVGSQDYNGAKSTDGGRTWKYLNPSGNGWGGYTYGGYAASGDVMYVGNAQGWGDPRILTITRDGGATWENTGLRYEGPDVSFGDPTDPRVLFASNLRSRDGGLTWKPMDGCKAVYTAAKDPKGHMELYGIAEGGTVVVSRDKGLHWKPLFETYGDATDIAVDPVRRRVYVAVDGKLSAWTPGGDLSDIETPRDQYGDRRLTTVAVDPVDPRIVYVGNHKNVYAASNSVCVSKDAGKSWRTLTLSKPLDGTDKDGGREAICVRVHPKTRELWVATSCYGIWKYVPDTK